MVRNRFCPETVEAILDAICHTGSGKAGWPAGGTAEATFYEWGKRYPEFEEEVT